MSPVAVHVAVAGLYSSALVKEVTPFIPPATSTFPDDNNVAVSS